MKLRFSFCLLLFSVSCFSQTFQSGVSNVNDDVMCMTRIGNYLYIGGRFTEIDSMSYPYLARLNATNGRLDTSWHPNPDGSVTCMLVQNGKLVIGGYFSHVWGQARTYLAVLDAATGALNAMTLQTDFPQYALGGDGVKKLYYCKHNPQYAQAFYDIIVRYDLINGSLDSWQTTTIDAYNDQVYALEVSGNWLYIGGADIHGVFVNNAHDYRFNNLLRCDLTTGAFDSGWQHPLETNTWVNDIQPYNGNIYVCGSFDEFDSLSRDGNIAYDGSGAVLPFQIGTLGVGDQEYCLFPQGGTMWIGGNAPWYGGSRYRVAQCKLINGYATCWDATPTSQGLSWVLSIFVSNDTVYVGAGGASSGYFQMYVGNPTPATPTIAGATTVLLNHTSTYHAVNGSGNIYNWSVTGGGSGFSNTDSIDLTFYQLGYDTIYLSETSGSCTGGSAVFVVNVVSTLSSTSSANANSLLKLQYASSNQLIIQTPSDYAAQTKLHIYDMLGQEVQSEDIWLENAAHINIKALSTGAYILQFVNSYGAESLRFIRE